jgi:hypothetical protein
LSIIGRARIYRAFFQHIDGSMRTMADLVRKRRYADEIMALPSSGNGTPAERSEAARHAHGLHSPG